MNPEPEDPEREGFRDWSRGQEDRLPSVEKLDALLDALQNDPAAVLHFLF